VIPLLQGEAAAEEGPGAALTGAPQLDYSSPLRTARVPGGRYCAADSHIVYSVMYAYSSPLRTAGVPGSKYCVEW
jgi:hypothetical protein